MMEIRTRHIRSLAYRCEEFLGESGKPLSIGYPTSLALCILDALFMTGSHPTAIDNVIDRYTARHGGVDGAKSLRYSIAAAGGSARWAREVIGNLRPAHTGPGALLRAEVVDRATRVMADHAIDTVEDLLAAVGDEPATGRHANEVARAWRELPSQKSGISWRALLVLAGSEHLTIDHRVRGYIYEVAPWPCIVTDDYVLGLVEAAAGWLDVDDRVVKQIVWQVSHRRLRPDPKRKELDLPYSLDDEIEFEPEPWPWLYEPRVEFEPEVEFEPGVEGDFDWAAPYPKSGTTGAAPFQPG